SVWREGRGHLGDAELMQRRLDDHLARELHPRGAEPERVDGLLAEAADAAVKVAARCLEEQAPDESEDRVAEVLVKERHRARLDTAAEAVAHDEVVALAELVEEARDLAEVVAHVGVAHEDEATPSGRDAS